MKELLTAEMAKGMLLNVAEQIIANKDYLTEADNKIADGDHGTGMALGMKKASEKLNSMPENTDVYGLFNAFGKAMLMSMGGASGVIFGSMFMAGAKGMEAKNAINCEEFAEIMERGLLTIKEKGKASVGDKTMVDALEPAVESMKAGAKTGLAEMLRSASDAASTGVENTKKYPAKYGRARTLGERAIGFPDAGAISVSIIFQSMYEYVSAI